MNTYTYTGGYFDIRVPEPLPEEGILDGQYGRLHFKRCQDGFSIHDSAFLGSGFVCTPTDADIGYPAFINDIPVTEIHMSLKVAGDHPIAVEGFQLKRVYLTIARETWADSPDPNVALAGLLFDALREQDRGKAEPEPLALSINFCKEGNTVELCQITCHEKCRIDGIAAKKLEIIAPAVVLRGKAHEALEHIKFTGRVYPFVCSGWDGEWQETEYFAELPRLKSVDGSLRGDICWSFRNCRRLEQVHLANGIRELPAYAFENCASLRDLYIPDTVTQLGEYAFAGCTQLATVHLPSNIKKIPKGLFKDCCSLTKCYLSDSIEEIEAEAFTGCTALRKPWIPRNIQKISPYAFDHPSWSKIPF